MDRRCRRSPRRPNGTFISDRSHAFRGGRAYPKETREEAIALFQLGGWDALRTPRQAQLRQMHKFPSWSTCKRWIRRWQQQGHILPKRPTGNRYSSREIQGTDLINLTLFRIVYPKAYIDEVRAFIHNRNPINPPYSRSQVHRAEELIGLTRKVSSTTSDLAHLPINLFKRQNYWTQPYPQGIADEDIKDMIDVDEMMLKVGHQNRGRGKVTREKRCDAKGVYKKGSGRADLLMAIGGESKFKCMFCL